MFVNVARRNQVLLGRQLSQLDKMEAREEDPDVLDSLFKLDHLATRMRRNAESLLVLAGIDSTRRLRRPLPLSDVIRTAVGEIEAFDRIDLSMSEDPDVSGRHALTVAHLLAELLENATHFSNPDTRVVVSASVTGHGVDVTVTDYGLGMSEDEVADANEKIAHPPVAEIAVSQRLGLFVVGRLASRLGATVELRRGRAAGTVVAVALPTTRVRGPGRPEPVEEVVTPVLERGRGRGRGRGRSRWTPHRRGRTSRSPTGRVAAVAERRRGRRGRPGRRPSRLAEGCCAAAVAARAAPVTEPVRRRPDERGGRRRGGRRRVVESRSPRPTDDRRPASTEVAERRGRGRGRPTEQRGPSRPAGSPAGHRAAGRHRSRSSRTHDDARGRGRDVVAEPAGRVDPSRSPRSSSPTPGARAGARPTSRRAEPEPEPEPEPSPSRCPRVPVFDALPSTSCPSRTARSGSGSAGTARPPPAGRRRSPPAAAAAHRRPRSPRRSPGRRRLFAAPAPRPVPVAAPVPVDPAPVAERRPRRPSPPFPTRAARPRSPHRPPAAPPQQAAPPRRPVTPMPRRAPAPVRWPRLGSRPAVARSPAAGVAAAAVAPGAAGPRPDDRAVATCTRRRCPSCAGSTSRPSPPRSAAGREEAAERWPGPAYAQGRRRRRRSPRRPPPPARYPHRRRGARDALRLPGRRRAGPRLRRADRADAPTDADTPTPTDQLTPRDEGRSDVTTLSTEAANFSWLLGNFVKSVPGVQHTLVVSADGLLMAMSDDSTAPRATSSRRSCRGCPA